MRKFWNWKNQDGETPERVLELNGTIADESWFDDDITPQMFKDELNAGSGAVTIWINSPGGDCVAASQIYSMLMDYAGEVTVKIDGIAASAASVIAMAGTKVLMSPTALMMIHNPSTAAFGDHNDMQKAIDLLEEVKQSIINAYEIKTGQSRAVLSHLMENETWMNVRKAVELGFADGILEDEKKTAAEPFMFSTKETDNALWGRITAKVTKDKAMSVVAKNATTDEPVPQGRKISELMSELQKIKKIYLILEELKMKTIAELRDSRAKLWSAMESFLDTHANDNGVLSAEDDATYNKMEKDLEDLTTEIKRRERKEAIEAELNKPVAAPLTGKPMTATAEEDEKKGRASKGYKKNFWNAMRSKMPSADVLNALSEGTDADGGFLVPDTFERTLVDGLNDTLIIRKLAHVFETASGAHKIPVVSAHGAASWTDEGAQIPETTHKFSEKSIGAHKLTALIKVSEELLNDSAFDLESYFSQEFARQISNAEEDAFVSGTGTDRPFGIFDEKEGGEVGVTTAGATITADELIDLYHSLRAPYRKKAVWLLNDTTIQAVRKLKDENKQYIWQPSLQVGLPDTLLGRPVYTTNSIPGVAAGAKVIAFGDLSYYWIGDRTGITFKRLNELYADRGQIGFLATKRVDARLVLPEAVKILQIKAGS